MDRAEVERIRRTPGTQFSAGIAGSVEGTCRGWYVDSKTGEVIPLGVLAYESANPLKRLLYRIKRRMGRI